MSELFLRLGFGFWSSILKESRDLTTFAYCLCSSDIESMCSSDIESMCSSDIESMCSSDIESKCSSDIESMCSSDIESKCEGKLTEGGMHHNYYGTCNPGEISSYF